MLSGTFYVHENLDGLKTYAENYSHYGNSFNISMHISYSSYHMECNIHMQLPPYLRCYFICICAIIPRAYVARVYLL